MSKKLTSALALLLVYFNFISRVAGQDPASPAGLISSVPDCAQKCLVQGFQQGSCNLTALPGCLCSNTALQANLSACVQATCSVEDLAAVSIASNQLCAGYPIESRSHRVKIAAIACAAITFPIVVLRCIARLMVTKKLWWDDWTAIMATIFLAAVIGLQIEGTKLGFGRHLWNVPVTNLAAILQMFYSIQILYILVQVSAKASLLAFYSRVFTDRKFRIAVWVAYVFLFGHGIIFLGLVIFHCIPVHSIWDRSVDGKCIDLTAIAYAGGVLSIIEDIAIFILPIPELMKLQLQGKKKTALLFMFSIGSFACVTSIVRLKYLGSFSDPVDPTWHNVYVVIWSTIELSCALICASLPALRPLVQMVPGVLSTVKGSSFKKTTDESIYENAHPRPTVKPDIESSKFKELPDLPVMRHPTPEGTEKYGAYLDVESNHSRGSYELQTLTRERNIV